MEFKDALERFNDYCKWFDEDKKPHIEAMRKYGLSVEEFFDELIDFNNAVYDKTNEFIRLIEADGFDIDGLKKGGQDNAG